MLNEKLLAQMRQQSATPYVWVIDDDHTWDPKGPYGSEAGAAGPLTAPGEVINQMLADPAMGEQFRMVAGEELFYSGRVMFFSEDRAGWDWFAPLDDFGRDNAGCTGIAYLNNLGQWVEV